MYKKYRSRYVGLILSLVILTNAVSVFAGDATLSWDPPTTNADGTPLTDLAGYKLYYGTTSGNYTNSVDVGNINTYKISGLAEGLTYYFTVTAYDAAGNESEYSNEAIKTIQALDATPPVISGIYAGNITTSSATINWTTDEASDTQVEYGITASYGNTSALDTSPVTSHSQTISGLSPSTQYHYRVLSRDSNNNLAVSSDYTFSTAALPDTTPPVILNVQVTNITESSATVTWTTDEPSSSLVEYGFNTSYGDLTPLNSNLVTIHSVDITGLSASHTYDFRVRSRDAAGNEALSANYSFTTSNLSPALSSFSATPITGFAPLLVDFTASATDPDGYILTYEWDFDGNGISDANTGIVPNASFTYTNEGVYNAKLKVTDNGGASTLSHVVTITVGSQINAPPVVSSLNATPSSGAAPLSVAFSSTVSDTDGTIVLYEWDFDGNGVYDASTTTNPVSHTYGTAGTYAARVRVTDDMGAIASGEAVITVNDAPTNTNNMELWDGCFIATAAYGSSIAPDVMVLRKFRDNYLLTNSVGRYLVAFYYKTSPPVAEYIAKHEALKLIIRLLLMPIVLAIKHPLLAILDIFMFGILAYGIFVISLPLKGKTLRS